MVVTGIKFCQDRRMVKFGASQKCVIADALPSNLWLGQKRELSGCDREFISATFYMSTVNSIILSQNVQHGCSE